MSNIIKCIIKGSRKNVWVSRDTYINFNIVKVVTHRNIILAMVDGKYDPHSHVFLKAYFLIYCILLCFYCICACHKRMPFTKEKPIDSLSIVSSVFPVALLSDVFRPSSFAHICFHPVTMPWKYEISKYISLAGLS